MFLCAELLFQQGEWHTLTNFEKFQVPI